MLNFGTFELILVAIAGAVVLLPVAVMLVYLWVSGRKKDK